MGLPSFDEFIDAVKRDVVEFAKDPANKVLDLVTGYDLNERDRVRDAQADGNALRDDLYLVQTPLYGDFDENEFDGPALGSPEPFEAMSHQEIKAAVDGMNGGSLRASAEGWTKIGESLDQALNDFRDFITNETNGKWEGLAQDSAAAATDRYATESGKLARAGKLIGTKITEAATGVDQVKATVPPVSGRSLIEIAFDSGVPGAGVFKRFFHAQDESHQEAIQIMRTVYTPVMHQADTNVPKLPEPPRVINESSVAAPSSGGVPGIGAPGSPTAYTGGPNSESPTPWAQAPGIPGPDTGSTPDAYAPVTPGTQPDANDQFTAPGDATTTATPDAAWTAPAAATGLDGARAGQSGYGIPGIGGGAGTYPGTSGLGSGSGTSSGSGGSAGGYGGGGILTGGYGSGGMGSGGGSAAGSSPSATAGGVPGSTAAGATGRGGAATGGMMPGGGARGRGDDDAEHKTPGYLVNVDNGSELIGDLPLAAPPVIGT